MSTLDSNCLGCGKPEDQQALMEPEEDRGGRSEPPVTHSSPRVDRARLNLDTSFSNCSLTRSRSRESFYSMRRASSVDDIEAMKGEGEKGRGHSRHASTGRAAPRPGRAAVVSLGPPRSRLSRARLRVEETLAPHDSLSPPRAAASVLTHRDGGCGPLQKSSRRARGASQPGGRSLKCRPVRPGFCCCCCYNLYPAFMLHGHPKRLTISKRYDNKNYLKTTINTMLKQFKKERPPGSHSCSFKLRPQI